MTKMTLWDSAIGDRPANLALTNNFSASVVPTVNNDSSQGYSAGSIWIVNLSGTASDSVWMCVDATKGAAQWVGISSVGTGQQGAPDAETVAVTLTAAALLNGIITGTQTSGANINYQLPLATAMDTALPAAPVNYSFDFSFINLSTGSNTITFTTNTGWTLVGNMVQAVTSTGRYRARKTATGAWTLYRLS